MHTDVWAWRINDTRSNKDEFWPLAVDQRGNKPRVAVPFSPLPPGENFSFGGEGTASRKLILLIRPKTCNVSRTWFFDYEVSCGANIITTPSFFQHIHELGMHAKIKWFYNCLKFYNFHKNMALRTVTLIKLPFWPLEWLTSNFSLQYQPTGHGNKESNHPLTTDAIDCWAISPSQHNRKYTENSIETMYTDARVQRAQKG